MAIGSPRVVFSLRGVDTSTPMPRTHGTDKTPERRSYRAHLEGKANQAVAARDAHETGTRRGKSCARALAGGGPAIWDAVRPAVWDAVRPSDARASSRSSLTTRRTHDAAQSTGPPLNDQGRYTAANMLFAPYVRVLRLSSQMRKFGCGRTATARADVVSARSRRVRRSKSNLHAS